MCSIDGSGRSILLHVRCGHCMKLYEQDVPVPDGAEMQWDDDLVESAFVRELKFSCPKCEGTYAEIVAFKIQEPENVW